MESYINLGIAALFPVIASFIFYFLESKTSYGKIPKLTRQIIIGIVFGGIAIIGTEWGIPLLEDDGSVIALVNCRDAAPICAGLFFGGPAGIIAGVIGGVERFIAVNWGVGTFTQVACSVATVIGGIYATLLRRFLFEDKRPTWLLALATGLVVESVHMLLVLLTNMNEVTKAVSIVMACAPPMIIANGLSVMLGSIAISFFGEKRKKQDMIPLAKTIHNWLFIIIAVVYIATTGFLYLAQTNVVRTNALQELKNGVTDVNDSVNELIKKHEKLYFAGVYETNDAYYEALQNDIHLVVHNRRIGKQGAFIVYDKFGTVITTIEDFDASTWIDPGIGPAEVMYEPDVYYEIKTDDGYYCSMYKFTNGYYIIASIPKEEAFFQRNFYVAINSFLEVIVFALLYIAIYFIIKRRVVKPIHKINRDLNAITEGNLDTVVNVRSNLEFDDLSDDINKTVDALKGYIAEAEARIDEELAFAKDIQASAVPSAFPAFPNRHEIEIYGYMNTAKEVGGDFYDFYFTEKGELNFLVADVSGKGIPAALFMMRGKTELKSLAENGLSLDEIFVKSNNALCEGNDADMFITAWQGALNVETGHVAYVNAGHNPPLVKRDGKFEYLKGKSGLFLAGMEGIQYKLQEFDLKPGDIIFTYTDGVTEATDSNNELYGEDRLLKFLNTHDIQDMKELCEAVQKDIDDFIVDAPQFDDITMVALKYNGKVKSTEG